jgi:hypothetical protein
METARVIALIGGLLVLIGLLVSFAIVYVASVGGLAIGPLIPLGFFIDFVCMIVLIFSEDSLLLLIAGILGTVSSFLLVGGIFGGIGGILGIVGSALMSSGGATSVESLRTLDSTSRNGSSQEQHFFRCPRCGYLNKADSAFCGQCRYPLKTEEKFLA